MGILFGTDGIRGVAGKPPLDADTIYMVAHCLTSHLRRGGERPKILLARDTRLSGPWIEKILRRGIEDAGGTAEDCGVISTPAISHLTSRLQAQAGIVISASHNPFEDNGIKVFSSAGTKFTDDFENELEREVLTNEHVDPPCFPSFDSSDAITSFGAVREYGEMYTHYLHKCLPTGFDLTGMRLVVDCAHGALSEIAPGFLSDLGAEVHEIHCRPNGRNINLDSGALHLSKLSEAVLARRAVLGIAFDGDADRAMFVDASGTPRDGDDVLYLLALHSIPAEAPRTIVGTVMANLGLEVVLGEAGFQLVRTAVGDRYVLEEMLRLGAVLGGEQSGHVILLDFAKTGDGLLTALKVMEVLRSQEQDMAELCRPLKRFPQVLRNISVTEKVPFSEIPGLMESESAWRSALGPRSRILLRYSGTENLARIMVEGENPVKVDQAAQALASHFQRLR